VKCEGPCERTFEDGDTVHVVQTRVNAVEYTVVDGRLVRGTPGQVIAKREPQLILRVVSAYYCDECMAKKSSLAAQTGVITS
jgi:hypothetical protein